MILSLYWSNETAIQHFSRTVAWCWIPESRVKNVTLSRVMYSVSSVTEGGRVRVRRVTASNTNQGGKKQMTRTNEWMSIMSEFTHDEGD